MLRILIQTVSCMCLIMKDHPRKKFVNTDGETICYWPKSHQVKPIRNGIVYLKNSSPVLLNNNTNEGIRYGNYRGRKGVYDCTIIVHPQSSCDVDSYRSSCDVVESEENLFVSVRLSGAKAEFWMSERTKKCAGDTTIKTTAEVVTSAVATQSTTPVPTSGPTITDFNIIVVGFKSLEKKAIRKTEKKGIEAEKTNETTYGDYTTKEITTSKTEKITKAIIENTEFTMLHVVIAVACGSILIVITITSAVCCTRRRRKKEIHTIVERQAVDPVQVVVTAIESDEFTTAPETQYLPMASSPAVYRQQGLVCQRDRTDALAAHEEQLHIYEEINERGKGKIGVKQGDVPNLYQNGLNISNNDYVAMSSFPLPQLRSTSSPHKPTHIPYSRNGQSSSTSHYVEMSPITKRLKV